MATIFRRAMVLLLRTIEGFAALTALFASVNALLEYFNLPHVSNVPKAVWIYSTGIMATCHLAHTIRSYRQSKYKTQ